MSFRIRFAAPVFFFVGILGHAQAPPTVDLKQEWTSSDVDSWEHSGQGSRLIPLAWFEKLERATSQEPFLDRSYLESFRYLYDPRAQGNDALPIGFVSDTSSNDVLSTTKLQWTARQKDQEPWLGLTCATCHTQKLTYRGSAVIVYGAGTLADHQSFIAALDGALNATLFDSAKFDRFATKVLGAQESADRGRLKDALTKLVALRNSADVINATSMRYGYGRLDAVGQILNRVELFSGAGVPTLNPPDAPVSYPFLWNVRQQKYVQWNGMATNDVTKGKRAPTFDIGALGRNIGEVIGVFADFDTHQHGIVLRGYPSSINVKNLTALEGLLQRLKSPVWPEALFGKLDQALLDHGKTLYANKCLSCHQLLPHDDLTTTAIENMISINPSERDHTDTDVFMACNAYMRQGVSARLNGASYTTRSNEKKAVTNPDNLSVLLQVTATRVAVDRGVDVAKMELLGFLGIVPKGQVSKGTALDRIMHLQNLQLQSAFPSEDDKTIQETKCRAVSDPVLETNLAYKARPLNGIWATAPYLHNGSVSSLYELLLPPDRRKPFFYTGTREFDPVHVGFLTDQAPDNDFRLDTSILGNLKKGHDYGVAELDHETTDEKSHKTINDRMALIEYLKSL
jgi:hypothetical protein